MADLITWEEAQRLVLEHVRPLEAEEVALEDAAGRVTAEAVQAQVDLPPFDSSAMDGYALRAEDTPGTLPVVHRIAAGSPAPRPLQAGEAMGIATGAAVPEGADAVIPLEYVVEHDNVLEITDAVASGASVRPVGGDVRRGEEVVPRGLRLGAAQVGAVAAAGAGALRCVRQPRTSVLATGSELRAPGEPLEPGQIYEANGPLLVAQLSSAGANVERLASVPDEAEAHRVALAAGLEGDVLITTGGVSVGPHDLVRGLLRELGVEEVFWGVSVKPGKPISFGVLGPKLVFGLPGNPVSVLVGFELFVRPALNALQGVVDPLPRWERAPLARAVMPNAHRDELIRARLLHLDDGTQLEPLAGRESHMIVRAAGADALVLVPQGDEELQPGAGVRYLRLA